MQCDAADEDPSQATDAGRFGGHLVLDFLNTVARTESGPVDQLGDAGAVRRWLAEGGLPHQADLDGPHLVEAATDLREVVRDLVQCRLSRTLAEPARLNRYLAAAEGHWKLAWRGADKPARTLVRKGDATSQTLAPLAEAAAELLASEDFGRVKRCGNPGCTMLFFDPSATSRRRWCDMATCGNRMKVAAHRQRRRGGP